jgi:hypothetical protein
MFNPLNAGRPRMSSYIARVVMTAALLVASAARVIRFSACAFVFAAAAAQAQIADIEPASPLPNAIVNQPYSVSFTTLPVNFAQWTITASCLNGSGLVFRGGFSRTATLSGTGGRPGSYSCIVTARAEGDFRFLPKATTIRKAYAFNVVSACVPPQITSAAPPPATAGVPYSFAVAATGTQPLAFTATGLPTGLSIDPATGVIAGTAVTGGSFVVSISVGGCGVSVQQSFTLAVNPAAIVLSLSSQPDPSIFGQAVTVLAHASGGAVVPTGSVLLCVVATGQFCASPLGAPPSGTAPNLIPPLLTAPLDSNGNASYTLTGLLIQHYVLQAYYGGDAGHGPAVSAPVDQFVIKGVVLPPVAKSGAPDPPDPPGPAPIPTLSGAALALLALAVAGVVAARSRRSARDD